MTAPPPAADIDRLIDALEAELLAASDDDLRTVLVAAGRLKDAAMREVRRLLAAEPEPRIERPRLHPGRPGTGHTIASQRPVTD